MDWPPLWKLVPTIVRDKSTKRVRLHALILPEKVSLKSGKGHVSVRVPNMILNLPRFSYSSIRSHLLFLRLDAIEIAFRRIFVEQNVKVLLGRLTVIIMPLFCRICRIWSFDREIKNPRDKFHRLFATTKRHSYSLRINPLSVDAHRTKYCQNEALCIVYTANVCQKTQKLRLKICRR